MKIAFISPYDFPYPGGVTEHIIGLANGVKHCGHEAHILAACSGFQGATFPNTRVVTHRIMPISIAGTVARVGLSPWSYSRIRKILRREAFDVIHLHEPLTPSMTWFVLMQSYALPRTVTIGTFHAYHEHPNWLYAHSRPVFSRLFTRLDGLIAVSTAARDFACQMFPGDYQIIPNGIDLARFGKKKVAMSDPCPTVAHKKVTILFVGRLDKRKGFPTLLEAFIKIKPDYPQLQLKVVGPFGPGQSQPYQKIAQAHRVNDIEFVGYVPPEKLPTLYHSADIFCAPSIGFESFGIVLLEAMAAGLPIVASDIAGYRAVITNEQEGLLVPPEQAALLATALCELINDPLLRKKMGARGRQKAGAYSWENVVEKILSVYHNIIERKFRAAPEFVSSGKSRIHLQQRPANPEGKSC